MNSKSIREEIFYWVTLAVGLGLLIFQAYQYFTNSLEGTWKDLAVFALGILLASAPRALSNTAEKAIKNKFGKNEHS